MADGDGSLAVFEPGRFEALHGVLQAVAVASQHESDWYIHLERNRDALADLGRPVGKREAERRTISQGKIVLDAQTQTLNADFVAQTLLLSDALNVSEYYAASLLQAGIASSGRWGRSPTDVAVLLFYREKLALLACLKELAQNAYTLGLEEAEALPTGTWMGRFVDGLLGPKATLLTRMLKEFDRLKDARQHVQQALQTAASSARLGDEIQLERLAWMEQEEQEMGHAVYLFAISRRLSPTGIEHLVHHAAQMDVQKATTAAPLYLLAAVLAVFDTTPDTAAEWLARHATTTMYTKETLRNDTSFLSRMHQVVTDRWACAGLHNVVLLQWSLFLLDTMQESAVVATQLGVTFDQVHALAAEAIAPTTKSEAPADHSALLFLLLHVLLFKHEDAASLDEDARVANALAAVDTEFQEYLLHQVEHLVLGTTSTLLPLLRKLQRAEEDVAFAAMRGMRPGASQVRRYDIEALFDLIAKLCEGRPESGLPFWLGTDRHLSRFLYWAMDMREPGQQRALLEMFAALATGEQCAGHAHAALEAEHGGLGGERGLVSWARLFDWIAHYIDLFRARGGSMPPEEMVLLRAFLQVLASVVKYSAAARDSLYLNSRYAPVAKLFALYACPVPVDLKAALLAALGAFAAPAVHGPVGGRVLTELWDRLQESGVLHVRKEGVAPAVYELEHVESAHYRYPGSTELVRFLTKILPLSTQAGRADALVRAASTASHPVMAAVPLLHSSGAYVAFVIDHVFLKASSRMYADPAERWRVSAACLDFVEHCLAAFPVQALEGPLDTAALTALVRHPGFVLIQRLLRGTPLLHELYFFLRPDANSPGFEALGAGRCPSPAYAHAVEQTLRIVLHLFRVQHAFLHVLCPALQEAGGALAAAVGGTGGAYVPLDVHLLHAPHMVVELALYPNCPEQTIAYLGVRALTALARSVTFQATDQFGSISDRHALNRLVGIVEMTGETERVRGGLLALLDVPPADAEEEPGLDIFPEAHRAAHLQRAVLDLLWECTAPGTTAPNIAHLLLGYDLHAASEDLLVGAEAHGRPAAMLRVLVELLDPSTDTGVAPLPSRAPRLAEQILGVLRHLCVHPYSSAATLRYVRTHNDLIGRLVAALPRRPATTPGHHGGLVEDAQGDEHETCAANLLALLHTDAHLLTLAALEVHALARQGQSARALPLVHTLCGSGRGPAQLVQVLDVIPLRWVDARDSLAATTALPAPAVLASAQVPDAAHGTKVYDLPMLAQILLAERTQRRASAQSAEEHATWLEYATHVLQLAAAQNTHRAVAHARRGALQSWRNAVGVLLLHGLPLLYSEARATLLLDVLLGALPLLQGQGTDDAHLAELAASGVLALLRALAVQDATQNVSAAPERALAVLRSLLEALLGPVTSGAARVDLLLALVAYLQLAERAQGTLAHRSRALLAAHVDRLLDIVARDALDGSEVGQTVALTTLAQLLRYDPTTRSSLAEALVQRGYLRSLVLQLQALDAPLQDVLSTDPSSLNAQYVYEALLSFFCHLAQTRSGAQQLLDAHLLRTLARLDFVSLRPDAHTTHDALEQDGFLPAVAERYAALLTPLLQLLAAVLQHSHESSHTSTGPFSANAARTQAVTVLLAHQDAFLAVLRAAAHPSAGLADAEQAALLVQILAGVFSAAEESTLDALHTSVLTLAAAYLGSPAPSLLAPQTPAEREDAAEFAPTLGGLLTYDAISPARATLFDAHALQAVYAVVRAVVQYIERTSSGASPRTTLVPTLHTQRTDGAAAAARMVAAPTLGAVVSALDTQLIALTGVLHSWERVHALQDAPDSLPADEWAEMARDGLGDAPVGPQALDRVAEHLSETMTARLDTVELLLVVLVRHLARFLQPVPTPGPTSTSMAPRTVPETLRSQAAPLLLPLVEKVALLPLPTENTALQAQTPFLRMAARRLADVLRPASS